MADEFENIVARWGREDSPAEVDELHLATLTALTRASGRKLQAMTAAELEYLVRGVARIGLSAIAERNELRQALND